MEMTNKEALEKLEYYTDSQSRKSIDYVWYGNIYQAEIDVIKKDLERLEQLEKIFSDNHICEIQARFNEIECTVDKCDNCPLGFESGICLKNTFERKWELQKENQKLKKVIRILKEKLGIQVKMFINGGCNLITLISDKRLMTDYNEYLKGLTKEEFDLLKEVLDNE